MNAYQFAQAEQAHEAKTLASHYDEEDAAEYVTKELQAEADEVWAMVVVDESGEYRDGIFEEAIGDLGKDATRHLAQLLAGHQDQSAGLLMREAVVAYWQAWCLAEAKKRIAIRNQIAADEAAMERAESKYGQRYSGSFE